MKPCTGEAQYTDDITLRRNELDEHLVLSTKPHAKLLKVDAEPALNEPGAVAFKNLASPEAKWLGAPSCDKVFFAVDEIFTVGQPIVMLLADTMKRAEQAACAVKVEYKDLPAIFTVEEAIQGSTFLQAARWARKEAGIVKIETAVLEGRFKV